MKKTFFWIITPPLGYGLILASYRLLTQSESFTGCLHVLAAAMLTSLIPNAVFVLVLERSAVSKARKYLEDLAKEGELVGAFRPWELGIASKFSPLYWFALLGTFTLAKNHFSFLLKLADGSPWEWNLMMTIYFCFVSWAVELIHYRAVFDKFTETSNS